jgi:hypothetical protein
VQEKGLDNMYNISGGKKLRTEGYACLRRLGIKREDGSVV